MVVPQVSLVDMGPFTVKQQWFYSELLADIWASYLVLYLRVIPDNLQSSYLAHDLCKSWNVKWTC